MAGKLKEGQMYLGAGLRRHLVWAALLLLLAVLAMPFDLAVAAFHETKILPGDFRRVVTLSEVFAHGFGLTAIVVSIWLFAPDLRRYLIRLALCGVLASGVAQLVKQMCARLRPVAYRNLAHQLELPDSVTATWTELDQPLHAGQVGISYFVQSFPSAHSAMAVGVAAGLCCLLPRGRWLFIVFAILACYQRIQSQAHWTSDVFAGAAIGMLVAGLLLQGWGLGWVLARYENGTILPSKSRVTQNEIS